MFFGSAYVNKCAFSSLRVHISIALHFSFFIISSSKLYFMCWIACNCSCGKFFKIAMRVVLSQVLNLHLVISSGDILLDKSSTLNPIPAEDSSRINLLWCYKRYKTIQIDNSSQLEGYVSMPKRGHPHKSTCCLIRGKICEKNYCEGRKN